MDSVSDDAALPAPGFPIRKSSAHSPLSGSPKLFAACHVLHRLLAPRHPPYALSSLTTSPSYHCALDPDYYPYAIVKDRMTNPEHAWIHAAYRSYAPCILARQMEWS